MVGVFEGSNEETHMSVALAIESHGSVRTTTLKAFPEAEAAKIFEKLPPLSLFLSLSVLELGNMRFASSMLSYHLNGLRPLLHQRDSDYMLSELGKHAYRLILGTTALGTETRLKMKIRYAIVANALLWAGATFSVSNWQERLQFQSMASLGALWFISNLILYQLSK